MLYVIRAVEERRGYVEEILKQIPDAVVYYDKDRDPMKSYLYVCEHIIKGQPAVLLEDDVVLTSNFREKIEAVINQYPKILINFFSLSKKHLKPHFKKGREHCMGQCEYYPAGFSDKVVEAYQSWPLKEKEPSATDYLTGYAWGEKNPYLIWCPNLVQHRECRSVINPRRSSKRQSVTFEK